MRTGDTTERTIALYQILKENSDEDHRLTMADLIAELSELGIKAERKSVYASIRSLNNQGYDIIFSRKDGIQGYYLIHQFSTAEAKILCDAVQDISSISPALSRQLIQKIKGELSNHQKKDVHISEHRTGKTDNEQVISIIETLLKAISSAHPVTFRYYDLSISKAKQYRRNKSEYELVPYAVISNNGRYYCVMYNARHAGFANYRIDKMEHVQMKEETAITVPFNTEEWMNRSFNMYTGDLVTISVEFDLDMASIVFDQFGTDILISSVTDKTFIANIKTSITPTLVSWLLQFNTRLRVLKPNSLIHELMKVAEQITNKYQK